MTKRARALRARHTRITCLMGKYSAYLSVGCQTFCVVEGTTKRRAEWYRDNLAMALEKLIKMDSSGVYQSQKQK